MEKKIDGVTYTVAQIMMDKMLPILPKLNSDDQDRQSEAQWDMVMASVSVNGAPVEASAMPVAHFMELSPLVLEVNGFAKKG